MYFRKKTDNVVAVSLNLSAILTVGKLFKLNKYSLNLTNKISC